MKFAGGFALLVSACLPLAIACGSAGNTNFFAEGGAEDRGLAGTASATAGLEEGGASQRGGAGGTIGGVAGRSSTGAAGKNGSGSSGASGELEVGGAGGSASAGTAGLVANAGNASAGKGGAAGAGTGGKAGASSGAGGTAGASAAGGTAGTGGAAGASSGAGGTAGASGNASGGGGVSGGSGSSGSSGWNGQSGSSGSAGASACPSNAPLKNSTCDVATPNSCFYAGQACSCLASTSGGINPTKKWACYGDGADCPSTKPTPGASCKQNADAQCPYPGNDFCVCSGNAIEAHWVCQASSPVCAPSKPLDDSCSTVKTCSWGPGKDVACFCDGSHWGCEGGF